MNTICTKSQLIETLTASPYSEVIWNTGSKPSAPGAYHLCSRLGGPEIRIHAKAVNDLIKLGTLRKVRGDLMFSVYRFRAVA